MRARAGWNTKWGERKFDVEADEDDIKRILQENGIPPSEASELRFAEAFGLVHHETEAYARLTLLQVQPFLVDGRLDDKQVAAVKAEMKAHRDEKDKIIKAIMFRAAPGG
jgi:hypothetical protein